MAAAANVLRDVTFEEITAEQGWERQVISLAESSHDHETKRRAAQFIGSLALEHSVESSGGEAGPGMNLLTALRLAREGETEARHMVETNVRTDVIERTIKSGHVATPIELQVDTAGNILQHGQTAKEIQANSLRYASGVPQMRRRTEAETRNMFRLQEQFDQGLLEEYAFVVFSMAADDMSEEQMRDVGFFTATMSCSIQVTTQENGRLLTEPAFVAGAVSPGAPRHDSTTITHIGNMLGADYEDKTATEILDMPLLIHKSLMPNGAIDVVGWYDQAAGLRSLGKIGQSRIT